MAILKTYKVTEQEDEDVDHPVTVYWDAITGDVVAWFDGLNVGREGEKEQVDSGAWKRKSGTIAIRKYLELQLGNIKFNPGTGQPIYIGKRNHLDNDPRT